MSIFNFFLKVLFFVLLLMPFDTYASAKPKDTLEVSLYLTSQDLYYNRPMDVNAIALTDDVTENYFYANKIIDKKTGKKVKDSKFIWAIKYNNGVYVNMGYINDMDVSSTIGMYIKLEIVGEYCALIYDDRMPYKCLKGARSNGLGLEGYINSKINEHSDDKFLWYVSESESVPILYCKLLEKEYRNFQLSRNESCLLQFISKNQLKKIREKYPEIAMPNEPKAIDALNCLEKVNLLIKNK